MFDTSFKSSLYLSFDQNLIEDVIDTLNVQPVFGESEIFKDREQIHDFYRFMNRNDPNAGGSYGNFEQIYPFNKDTLELAHEYSENAEFNPERPRDKIVDQVREKFGERFKENRLINNL